MEKKVRSWTIEVGEEEGNHKEIIVSGLKRGKFFSFFLYYHPLQGLKIWEGYGKLPSYLLKEVFKMVGDKNRKKYVSIVDKHNQTIDFYAI